MDTAINLVRILAMVMFGESNILHNDTAAMAVGHVFLNRLESGIFGDTPEEVSKGFHAMYLVEYDDVPEKYIKLAELARSEYLEERDITRGSLYIISYQDTQTIAAMAGYPHHASALRVLARWTSKSRFVDGSVYRLYAYKNFPVTLLQDAMKSVHEDSKDNKELIP